MTEQTMQSAQDGDEEEVKLPGLPANTKNYMTPACYRRLLDEREHLVNVERPQDVSVVSWEKSTRSALWGLMKPIPITGT